MLTATGRGGHSEAPRHPLPLHAKQGPAHARRGEAQGASPWASQQGAWGPPRGTRGRRAGRRGGAHSHSQKSAVGLLPLAVGTSRVNTKHLSPPALSVCQTLCSSGGPWWVSRMLADRHTDRAANISPMKMGWIEIIHLVRRPWTPSRWLDRGLDDRWPARPAAEAGMREAFLCVSRFHSGSAGHYD